MASRPTPLFLLAASGAVLSKAADEKGKLTANYLNGLAWPQPRWVFSHRLSLTEHNATTSTYQIATIAVVCLLLSVALHFSARQALEGMDE